MGYGGKQKLVIIGVGETAELAYEYFTRDSPFKVEGFSVEEAYITNKTQHGVPVVPLEQIEKHFDPNKHRVFVAVSYTGLNRLRTRLLNQVKAKGYLPCSYISPKTFIAENSKIGQNCFIFENVVVQRGAQIGDNTIIWCSSSIGHRSSIGQNCFLASQVAVSGFVDVGENCFFGVNSCVVGGVKIGGDCVVGAGAVIIKDAEAGRVYVGNPAKPVPNKNVISFIEGAEQI
ncbi:MAG: acetyltransferase [Candidatus Bathyarchaeota archaeon]|nr:acetyltransferase [Candidatus Bathyarchaeota archaeon]